MSPIAPCFTFMADHSVRVRQLADGTYIPDATQKAYGVDPRKSVRTEWLAFRLQAALNKNLTDNISLNTRYQLFSEYAHLDNINHRLDFLLTAKASQYLSTTIGLILLYNKDFSSDLQIQQTLAVGLVYNLSSFKKKRDALKADDPLPGRF